MKLSRIARSEEQYLEVFCDGEKVMYLDQHRFSKSVSEIGIDENSKTCHPKIFVVCGPTYRVESMLIAIVVSIVSGWRYSNKCMNESKPHVVPGSGLSALYSCKMQ